VSLVACSLFLPHKFWGKDKQKAHQPAHTQNTRATMKIGLYSRTALWLVLLGIVAYWLQRNASNVLVLEQQEQEQLPSVLVAPPHQQKNGTRFSYNAKARKYNDMPRWMDRYPFLPAVEDVPDDQRICFVHVGKTGGSTMACQLGFQFPVCHDRMRVLPGNLPLHTTNIMHTHYDTCERENIGLYLFTLRDPVSRMQSWFTYERPYNESVLDYRFKKPLFVDCKFNTLNELGGSRGLGGKGRNMCSKMAWWAVQGIVGFKVRLVASLCQRSRTYGFSLTLVLTNFPHTHTQCRTTISTIMRTITTAQKTPKLLELQRFA